MLRKFIPTKQDKEWLDLTWDSICDYGLLETDIGIYRKDQDLIVLEAISESAYIIGFNDIEIERECYKIKAIAESINLRFFDARPAKSN